MQMEFVILRSSFKISNKNERPLVFKKIIIIIIISLQSNISQSYEHVL